MAPSSMTHRQVMPILTFPSSALLFPLPPHSTPRELLEKPLPELLPLQPFPFPVQMVKVHLTWLIHLSAPSQGCGVKSTGQPRAQFLTPERYPEPPERIGSNAIAYTPIAIKSPSISCIFPYSNPGGRGGGRQGEPVPGFCYPPLRKFFPNICSGSAMTH